MPNLEFAEDSAASRGSKKAMLPIGLEERVDCTILVCSVVVVSCGLMVAVTAKEVCLVVCWGASGRATKASTVCKCFSRLMEQRQQYSTAAKRRQSGRAGLALLILVVVVVEDNVGSSTNNGIHRTIREGVFLLVLPVTIELAVVVVIIVCS